MRQMMVAGNWKMNGSTSFVTDLLQSLLAEQVAFASISTLVAPAFVHLPQAAALLVDTKIALGAQNMCEYEQGAYTGEVAGSMLTELGCRYVILGHSERRQYFAEDNALVARKVLAAQQAGLTPILCLGETLEQRENGVTEAVITEQLMTVLSHEGVDITNMVFAYEPVWAIGTGVTASPEEAQAVHALIRSMIQSKDAQAADSAVILYGGSVKPDNAPSLFAKPDIDGALVGGAALNAAQFISICKAAEAAGE